MKENFKKYTNATVPNKQFQIKPSNDIPFIETRKGNIYNKYDVTEEYQQEREIRESIKQELREFFYDDMIQNPQRVENMVDKIRENKWETLNDITDQFILDIDKCELTQKDPFLQRLKTQRSKLTPNETIAIENLLSSKYNQSLENFRIEINYNVTPSIGRYEKKIKFKNTVPSQGNKEKKRYWDDYEFDYDFSNQSESSQENIEDDIVQNQQEIQKQINLEKIEQFYQAKVLGIEEEQEQSTQLTNNKTSSSEKNVSDSPLLTKKRKIEKNTQVISKTTTDDNSVKSIPILQKQEKTSSINKETIVKKQTKLNIVHLNKKEDKVESNTTLLQKRTLSQMVSQPCKQEIISLDSSSSLDQPQQKETISKNKSNNNDKNQVNKIQPKVQQKVISKYNIRPKKQPQD